MGKYLLFFFFLFSFSVSYSQDLGKANCKKEDCLSKMAKTNILSNSAKNYEEAFKLAKEAKDGCLCAYGDGSTEYGSSLVNLAILYSTQGGTTDEVSSLLLEALEIYKDRTSMFDKLQYSTILTSLGAEYEKMTDYEKAKSYYSSAMKILEENMGKNNQYYAVAINNLAGLYIIMDDYEKATSLMIEAVDILKATFGKTHYQYINGLNNLAQLYCKKREYHKAEPLYEKIIVLGKESFGEKSVTYGVLLGNYGGYYMDIGEYEKALSLYIKAKDIQQNNFGGKHDRYASSLNNLAQVHKEIGSVDYALELFYEAVEVWKHTYGDEHPEYANSLVNLSTLLSSMKRYEEALSVLEEAMSVFQKTLGKDHPNYATSLSALGNLHAALGKEDEALPFYLEAKGIHERRAETGHINYNIALNNIAGHYWKKGNYSKALSLYKEINAARKKTMGGRHSIYLSTLLRTAILLYEMDREKEAISLFQEYILNTTKNIESRNLLMSEVALMNYVKKQMPSMYGLLSILINEKNELNNNEAIKDSYNFHLLTKSLGYQKKIDTHIAALNSEDTLLLGMYKDLKILYFQYGELAIKPASDSEEREISNKIIDAETKIAMMSEPFKKQLETNKKTIDFNDISSTLENNEAVIDFIHFQYHNGKEWTRELRYAAYLTLPNAKFPLFINLCTGKEIKELLDIPVGKEEAMSYIESSETNAELYSLIFAPIERHLKGINTLHISRSGSLYRMTFHAFIDKGKSMKDKYEIHYYNTARDLVFNKMNRREYNNSKTIALFGNPQFNASVDNLKNKEYAYEDPGWLTRGNRNGFSPLPETKKEIKNIRKYANEKGWNANIKIDISANEATFKSLSGKKVNVIHLATHGYSLKQNSKINNNELQLTNQERIIRQKNPLFRSGLALSGANKTWEANTFPTTEEDGLLTAYEISTMDLFETDLVVLSACNTGLGDILSGEGVFGLQRAFKIAGVKNTIVSLWEVDDEATRLLMEYFYKNYFEGKTAYESLKFAQEKMREGKFSEPYYWAGFILIE